MNTTPWFYWSNLVSVKQIDEILNHHLYRIGSTIVLARKASWNENWGISNSNKIKVTWWEYYLTVARWVHRLALSMGWTDEK